MDVDILSVSENTAKITFGGAEIEVPSKGAKMRRNGLAVRGEHLTVGGKGSESDVVIRALLKAIIYRGTNFDYQLELSDGQQVIATSTRRYAKEPQEYVEVSVDPKHLILLEE